MDGPDPVPGPEPVRGGAQRIPTPPANRPGGPPPWASLPAGRPPLALGAVRAALAAAPPPRPSAGEGPGRRTSAVLVPLFEDGGEVRVVLTRRAQHLRSHRGEVSFPGGGREEGEDLVATALREAWEEVGLDPGVVEVVAELDHLDTWVSRTTIVPFVGFLPGPPTLVPNPAEVERILYVSLEELLLPSGVYRQEEWGPPPRVQAMHFFDVVGDTIWGATGRILHDFLALVTAPACHR